MFEQILQNKTLAPVTGRTFFVGDIHGQYSRLMEQLEDIGFDFGNDQLICTGDLIDRGTEVISCIGLLNEPWFHSVLGNHELMFIQGQEDPLLSSLHLGNGGEWVYDYDDEVLSLLVGMIKRHMPMTLQLEVSGVRIGVVHACSYDRWTDTITANTEEQFDYMTWDFSKAERAAKGFKLPVIEGIDLVISGHHCVSEATVGANQLWIDTYYKTGRFTIISADQALGHIKEE